MLAPHRAPPTTVAQRAPSPQMMAKSQMYETTRRKASWLPGSDAPTYLDGSLAGDVGFDPYCMVAFARTGTAVGKKTWTNVERETQMVIMTDYERKRKVTWTLTLARTLALTRSLTTSPGPNARPDPCQVMFMREAEVKHARLAMLAAAGWPLSELLDGPPSTRYPYPYPYP